MKQIGYISANIAGDYRYTDTIEVYYDRDDSSVTVILKSSTALGGMDGPGGSTPSKQKTWNTGPHATPKSVLDILKPLLANTSLNFKKYGKPTKNFVWGERAVWSDNIVARGVTPAAVAEGLKYGMK